MLPRYRVTRVLLISLISALILAPLSNAAEPVASQNATPEQGIAATVESQSASSSINGTLEKSSSNNNVSCAALLTEPARGSDAIRKLGANIAEAAKINNKTQTEYKALFNDDTHWVDTCGRSFFIDPIPEEIPASPSAAALPGNASIAISALQLHSKLGSPRTLYLDFNPRIVSNTVWNANYNSGTSWNTPGFSIDSDYSTFSSAELTLIFAVWEQVAEDYAAFDIDVTTEQPAAGILERTDSADNIYGTKVIISDDSLIQNSCGCGGISYIGISNLTGSNHEYYQPSWVFSHTLYDNAKYIAEAISHEAGHAFGLAHQGTSTASYYSGANGWAPIMGVGYSQPLTQWSKGEYQNANNLEDEYVLMSLYGLKASQDEDANTIGSARNTWVGNSLGGVISAPTDVDYFKFTPSASGSFTFSVTSGGSHQNLDLKIDLLSSNSTSVIQSVDPVFIPLSNEKSAGLSASFIIDLLAGNTYFLKIDGTGYLTPLTGGYSDYGSVGKYSLDISGPVGSLGISNQALPNANLGSLYSYQLSAVGGYPQYSWTASGMPSGLAISSNGLISGTPTNFGSYLINVTVSDSQMNVFTQKMNLNVNDKLAIQSSSIPQAVVGRNYSSQLLASGGSSPYQWTAISMPAGLTLGNSGSISGILNSSGTFILSVQLTDAIGQKIQSSFSLVVNPEMSLTTTSLPYGSVGVAYNTQVSFTGGLSPVIISSVNLPAGLAISTTGLITGTPTIAGTTTVFFNLQDSAGFMITSNLTFTISSSLIVTTANLPGASLNTAYSFQFSGSGGVAPYSYTSTSLPAGLTLSSSGVLSGKPSKSGTFTFTVSLMDSLQNIVQKSFNLVVTAPLAISSSSLPSGISNTAYNTTLNATGGTSPYRWSSGVLPNGLSISTSGTLSGTPVVPGTTSITFTVVDTLGRVANRTLSLTVNELLVISTTALPNGIKGLTYSAQLQATGGIGNFNWSRASGSLPSGISLSSTGSLTGIPTKTGIYKFTIKVISGTQSSSISLSITIN